MSRVLPTISALSLLLATAVAHAGASNGVMPTGFTDHTASRVDTEVFGWSRDFSQVAAVAVNTHRDTMGGQRGHVLLVVWSTGDIKPIENVEINVLTAAALPHDPVGLEEAKNRLFDVDYNLSHTWPRRPKKERPSGWMTVDTLWDPVMVSKTDCQPAVSFVMSKDGETRFQPHQIISDIRANCNVLKMTHVRTYWAKPDLAVAMAKFEWSPDDHEMSFRQPVTASWDRGRPLTFVVRSAEPHSEQTVSTATMLSKYGRVHIEPVSRGARAGIAYGIDLKILGDRLGRKLSLLRTDKGSPIADVTVTLGTEDDPDVPAARYSEQRLTRFTHR